MSTTNQTDLDRISAALAAVRSLPLRLRVSDAYLALISREEAMRLDKEYVRAVNTVCRVLMENQSRVGYTPHKKGEIA